MEGKSDFLSKKGLESLESAEIPAETVSRMVQSLEEWARRVTMKPGVFERLDFMISDHTVEPYHPLDLHLIGRARDRWKAKFRCRMLLPLILEYARYLRKPQ